MAQGTTPRWDVFISHNRRDKPWVRNLVSVLRGTGLSVYFDEDSSEHGNELIRSLEDALEASRKVLLVLSPASTLSRWVAAELALTVAYDARSAEGNRIVPILLEPTSESQVRATVRSLTAVNLTTPSRESELRRLIDTLLESAGIKMSSSEIVLPRWPASAALTTPVEVSESGKAIAIGAHWDDVLLGCLGTLLRLRLFHDYEISIALLCSTYGTHYYRERQNDLDGKIRKIYDELSTRYGFTVLTGDDLNSSYSLSDRHFKEKEDVVSTVLGSLARSCHDYNLVLTPPLDDQHEDHATTGRVSRNCFREPHQKLLEFEVKKYTERHFLPNIYVGLDRVVDEVRSLGNLKADFLSELVVEGRNVDGDDLGTEIAGADRAFGSEMLTARMLVNSSDYGGNVTGRLGEVFRGRIFL